MMDRETIERWGADADVKRHTPLVTEPGGEKHHLLSRIVELAAEARALDLIAEAARALDTAIDVLVAEQATARDHRASVAAWRNVDRRKAELRRVLGDRYLS